jgi:hypothetical protein
MPRYADPKARKEYVLKGDEECEEGESPPTFLFRSPSLSVGVELQEKLVAALVEDDDGEQKLYMTPTLAIDVLRATLDGWKNWKVDGADVPYKRKKPGGPPTDDTLAQIADHADRIELAYQGITMLNLSESDSD